METKDQRVKIISSGYRPKLKGPFKLRAVSEGYPTYAQNLGMELLIVPPGGTEEPHHHSDYETAIFVISGQGIVKFGDDLEDVSNFKQYDFLFIPPNVYHQPINTDESQPLVAIISRNTPYDVREKNAE